MTTLDVVLLWSAIVCLMLAVRTIVSFHSWIRAFSVPFMLQQVPVSQFVRTPNPPTVRR